MTANRQQEGHSDSIEPIDALLTFRSAKYEGVAAYEARRQPWGKVGFAITGVMEFEVEGRKFLSPPNYATWIPANALHRCQNRQSVRFISLYIRNDLCVGLPDSSCTLVLSPLIKSIFSDFSERGISVPESADDVRLAHVLLDQLRKSPRKDSYLPISDDALLKFVTNALQSNPGDRRSLNEWAALLNTTEKTLSRRFQNLLGVSFNEWRQRQKLVTSLSMLEDGRPVHEISDELGYSTPSAFIAMFKKLTGTSPTNSSYSKL